MKKVDFIIVGLGLAGACLALQCRNRGRKVLAFDCPAQNKASVVATGLFSPVTGMKMVKTWKADILFPYLHTFYAAAEKILQCHFFYPLPCYIPFLTVGEQNEWMGKSSDLDYKKYISSIHTVPQHDNYIHNAIGGIRLSNCGYIDTRVFLQKTREMLQRAALYREEKLDEAKLEISPEKVLYGDLEARKIILCTGIDMLSSSYFGGLPLRSLKGETIHIDTGFSVTQIYKRGVYICGTGQSSCTVGATYDRVDFTLGPTEKGKMELVEKTKKLLAIPFKITHHNWGIRPITVDRRPLIGGHPIFKNVFVFNGLGTKGVSLAPWFAGQIAQFLDGEGSLEKEISISRVQPSH